MTAKKTVKKVEKSGAVSAAVHAKRSAEMKKEVDGILSKKISGVIIIGEKTSKGILYTQYSNKFDHDDLHVIHTRLGGILHPEIEELSRKAASALKNLFGNKKKPVAKKGKK